MANNDRFVGNQPERNEWTTTTTTTTISVLVELNKWERFMSCSACGAPRGAACGARSVTIKWSEDGWMGGRSLGVGWMGIFFFLLKKGNNLNGLVPPGGGLKARKENNFGQKKPNFGFEGIKH